MRIPDCESYAVVHSARRTRRAQWSPNIFSTKKRLRAMFSHRRVAQLDDDFFEEPVDVVERRLTLLSLERIG